jgi:hypothetical protein
VFFEDDVLINFCIFFSYKVRFRRQWEKIPGTMVNWSKAPLVRSGKLNKVGPAGSIPLGENFDFQKNFFYKQWSKIFFNKMAAYRGSLSASERRIKKCPWNNALPRRIITPRERMGQLSRG